MIEIEKENARIKPEEYKKWLSEYTNLSKSSISTRKSELNNLINYCNEKNINFIEEYLKDQLTSLRLQLKSDNKPSYLVDAISGKYFAIHNY